MSGTGFAPYSNVQLSQEPVAIISVDTSKKMAQGLTRVRAVINIDCTYPIGGLYVLPAVGDQWYVERLNDQHWKLVTRIPFNDNNTLIEPVPGQMIVGGTGPVVLNGSHVDVPTGTINLGDAILRGEDSTFDYSVDGGETWHTVGTSHGGGVYPDGAVGDIDDITGLEEALDVKVTGSDCGTPTALILWTGTQDDYDAIPVKDPATVYIVTPPP